MKKPLCCALCLLLVLSLSLGALCDSTPLIYKVTDENGNYIFLLGTMHVINEDTLPIARFDELMDQVDTVVLELGEEFFTELTDEETPPLSERLGQLRTQADNGLSETLIKSLLAFFVDLGCRDLDAELLRHIPTYQLYLNLMIAIFDDAGLDVSGAAVDKYVYREAKARGLTVLGVETMEEQTGALSDYLSLLDADGDQYIDEDAFYLLIDGAAAIQYTLNMLCLGYNTGNRELLMITVINTYQRAGIDEVRNKRFFDAAMEQLENGSHALIAVGAYHVLCEEDGLVTALTNAGYTVERWQ